MQQERIPKEQIQKDVKNGVCKVIDCFFVYSDKVVQYTSHFGYTINRGTLYKANGMVVTRVTDKKRFSIARLIAKAFLLEHIKLKKNIVRFVAKNLVEETKLMFV